MTESYGNGGEEGDGRAGLGGHGDAGQARHGHGHVLAVHRQQRHGRRSWRGRQQGGTGRLGLTGRIRGRAPVTRWPPHLPIQGNLLLELMHVLFRSWVRLDVCMCLFMVHVSFVT